MSNPSPIPTIKAERSKQKTYLIRATAVFIILAFLYLIYWIIYSRHYEETENAYVSGNIIPVTAQVGGTIVAVKVNDTGYVKQGDTLVVLDSIDRKIALKQAEADLALSLRQTEQLYAKDKGLRAAIVARELTLKQASSDLQRRQQAIHIGGISQEELTHAQDAFNIAQSMLTSTKSEWDANRQLIQGTTVAAHPNVLKAIAGLKTAYLALKRTDIKAPVSGYISKRSAQVGQVAAPGSILMAVVPLEDVWVDANFKERQLAKIRPGQSVALSADIYGSSVEYHGRVVGFSGGTGSAFALLPAQNATGNWIKVVQRLPVRISINAEELNKHPLRIGLSMDVSVDTSSPLEPINQGAMSGANQTPIFDKLDAGVDALIAQIIQDNVQAEPDLEHTKTIKGSSK